MSRVFRCSMGVAGIAGAWVVASIGAVSPAHAQVAPPPRAPSLTLPAGRLNVVATVEVEATAAKAGKPTSVAPDVSYGVTDSLTVSLVHSTFAVTGFRGGAGRGLCLTGEDRGCVRAYNNVGAEAMYSLARGALSVAAVAGVHATNLDAGFYAAKAALRLRVQRGPWSVLAVPSVLVALNDRDATPANKDQLFAPVLLMYKAAPQLSFGFGSGLKGPLDGLGDAWEVPLGTLVTYAVSPRLGLGTSLVFGKFFGGADDPPAPAAAATGPRYRAVQAWASFTL